jgi:hypothetical protein
MILKLGAFLKIVLDVRFTRASMKVRQQKDSSGTSDVLASSSHNCDKIFHDVPPFPAMSRRLAMNGPIDEGNQVCAG